jgi:hypothetical protein
VDVVAPVIPPVIDIVTPAIPPVVDVVTPIIPPVVDVVTPVIPPVVDVVTPAIAPVVDVIDPVVDAPIAVNPPATAGPVVSDPDSNRGTVLDRVLDTTVLPGSGTATSFLDAAAVNQGPVVNSTATTAASLLQVGDRFLTLPLPDLGPIAASGLFIDALTPFGPGLPLASETNMVPALPLTSGGNGSWSSSGSGPGSATLGGLWQLPDGEQAGHHLAPDLLPASLHQTVPVPPG